ncbi:hypothetical protein M422DRAFT_175897, partial [Sphaerobolus stellatus SS14]
MDLQFPTTSILMSHFAPDINEAYSLRQKLTLETDRLTTLDRAIDALNIVIQQLNSQREEIQTSCDIARELLSPMRRLPVELLQKILVHTLPSQDLSLHAILSSRVRDPEQAHPAAVRATTMGVCRRWRDIVDTTPELW